MHRSNRNRGTERAERITELPLARIMPNPDQPRKDLGAPEKLDELAQSIRQEGLIQPIIVRKRHNKFQIVVGERRWHACKIVGMDKIPVIIRDVDDQQVLLQSLIENVHRKDLTSVERENAVYELWRSGAYKTKRALADGLGYRESSINELIEAKEFRDKKTSPGEVSTKVIRQTRGIKDDDLRAQVIEKIQQDKIPSDEVMKRLK